jgi:isopenicillin N synthase-like dioxygenase
MSGSLTPFRRGFNFGSFDKNHKAAQPIPSTLEPHEAFIGEFSEACHDLCRKILLLFGIGLGVTPPDFFEAAHSPDLVSGSILRFLYYPPPNTGPTAAARASDGKQVLGAFSFPFTPSSVSRGSKLPKTE